VTKSEKAATAKELTPERQQMVVMSQREANIFKIFEV
jgi:hypothetical protein